MNFEMSEQQVAIRDAVGKVCANFGDDYWLARDADGEFPEEFVKAITDGVGADKGIFGMFDKHALDPPDVGLIAVCHNAHSRLQELDCGFAGIKDKRDRRPREAVA